MLCNISQLNKLFINNKIKVVNENMNEIIKNYSFIYLSDTNEINQNTKITKKINDSKLLVIYYCKSNQEKPDLHFIVGFKKTILIIKQSLFFSVFNSLISINHELEICFLSDTKNLFEQFVKIKYNESESNSYLNEEISKINQNLLITNSKLFSEFWRNISSCISGYLIKISYYKLNKNRIKSFNSKEQNHPKEFTAEEYIELRFIGSTNTCEVGLFYHIQNEELHIIKKGYSGNDENFKLLNRELFNYSIIRHPFLPIFYGKIQNKNFPVIEFINGKNLFEIDINQLSKEEKFEIILQILSVIMYLHENNFIYRDLKPNNVMIDKQKTIILIDFDRMIKNSDEVNTIDFSHQYAAPEINSNDINEKVDIYSIGQMIYYILNGMNPNDIKPPSFIEFEEYPEIKMIYYKCINKDSNERPNIIELTNNLITYIANEEIDVNNINSEDCLKIGLHYYHQEKMKKSVHYLTLAADLNNSDAQYILGSIYNEGMYITRDMNKTIQYFQLANNKSLFSQLVFESICAEEDIIKQDIKKSIYYYELAANQNHPKALFNLGNIYFEGKYVPQNIDKYIHYLNLAANQNYPDALYNLGLFYYEGKYIKIDIKQSIQYFTSAANKNHTMAQYNLGIIYYEGKYVKRDINLAIKYLSLASNDGNLSDAQVILGLIYYDNKFIERDIYKSIHYYKLAADQDNPIAQYNLGIVYFRDKYIKQDINAAINYITLASNHNFHQAQLFLGFIFYIGEYIERNIDKAIHYFSLSAKQNNTYAQSILGVIYYEGKYTVRDINKSLYFFTLAAKQKDPISLRYIGEIYFEGIYITRDINKGIYYYTLASNQDNSYAQLQLGLIYYRGKFVPQNIAKSIHYLTLSANHNERHAQFYLGLIYLLDENVEQDIKKSIHFFTLSANHDHPISQYVLGFLYFSGLYIQQNIYKGIDYIMQSSNNGFDYANFFLGFQFHEGKYLKRDIQKSIHFYKESSSFNNAHAKNNLGIIYKNGFDDEIQQNSKWAIVYFKEAMKEDSWLSMYNLAHTYIFNKTTQKSFDKSIDLLIKTQKDFYPSLKLLSLILVKKYGMNSSNIKNELKKNKNFSNDLLHKIMQTAKFLKLDDLSILQKEYNESKKIDFLYGSSFNFIISKDLFDNNQNDNKNYVTKNKFNINSDFYDGFGHDI